MRFDWIKIAFEQLEKQNPYHHERTGEFCSPGEPGCTLHVKDGIISGVNPDGTLYELTPEQLRRIIREGPRRLRQLAMEQYSDLMVEPPPGQRELRFMEQIRAESMPEGFTKISKKEAKKIINNIENKLLDDYELDIEDLYNNNVPGCMDIADEFNAFGDFDIDDEDGEDDDWGLNDEYIPEDVSEFSDIYKRGSIDITEKISNIGGRNHTLKQVFVRHTLLKNNIDATDKAINSIIKAADAWASGTGDGPAMRALCYNLLMGKISPKEAQQSPIYRNIFRYMFLLHNWAKYGAHCYKDYIYRGIKGDDFISDLENMEIGQIYHDNSLRSWTNKKEVAIVWGSDNSRRNKTAVLVFNNSEKQINAIPIALLSDYPEESEILVTDPMVFRIKGKTREKNILFVDLELVTKKKVLWHE